MSEKHTPPPGQELAEHTPVPWRVERKVINFKTRILAQQGPITVCPALATGELDAAFIVRAVNCHDDLVKALEHSRRNLVVAIRAAGGGDPEEHVTIKEIDAVLKRARGGQA